MNIFKELDIDSAELFEDILIADNSLIGKPFKDGYFFILNSSENIAVEVFKTSKDTYQLKLVINGFYCEDYDLNEYNIEVSKDELFNTIEQFKQEFQSSTLRIKGFLCIKDILDQKFTLKGINFFKKES